MLNFTNKGNLLAIIIFMSSSCITRKLKNTRAGEPSSPLIKFCYTGTSLININSININKDLNRSGVLGQINSRQNRSAYWKKTHIMIFIIIAKCPMVLLPILSTGKAPATACEDSPLSAGCSACSRLWLWALQAFQENTLSWAIGLTDDTKNCSLMEQGFCSQWREIRAQLVSDKVSWIVT